MKPLLQTFLLILLFDEVSAQNIEVRSLEYVWDRASGDNRIVLVKDSLYREILKKCFTKAIVEKWNVAVPDFAITISKLSALRSQPKFNTSIPNADTSRQYLFIQLYDPVSTSKIDVKYRLLKGGATVEDKSVSYRILRRNTVPGQIQIKRYPFHPSQFKLLCDTIASSILNDNSDSEKEVWLEPAYGYTDTGNVVNFTSSNFEFINNRQSIRVNGFSIIQDSISDVQRGRKRHGAANTAGSLLTFFSNIDTEKKRSYLHTADHSFSEGSASYHAYISYVDTKVAERHRVKDEEGFKSIDVGEYEPGSKEINPKAVHVITMNGDTVSSFNIVFRLKEDRYRKFWDGRDSSTVDSLPVSFNNFATSEIEMKGTIDKMPFVLTASGEGQIKKITIDKKEVLLFYSNTGPHGVTSYNNLDERQLKIAIVLCLLSDKYYQYK
jgi:hypothetical protein